MVDKGTDLSEACSMINKLILQGVLGINSLVAPNTINCKSLEQLCNIIKGNNIGHIGYSTVNGKENLIEALYVTADNLWRENSIKESVQVMLFIHCNVSEIDEPDVIHSIKYIQELAGHSNVSYGIKNDEYMTDEIAITIIVLKNNI